MAARCEIDLSPGKLKRPRILLAVWILIRKSYNAGDRIRKSRIQNPE
jgi:hypothetical protein